MAVFCFAAGRFSRAAGGPARPFSATGPYMAKFLKQKWPYFHCPYFPKTSSNSTGRARAPRTELRTGPLYGKISKTKVTPSSHLIFSQKQSKPQRRASGSPPPTRPKTKVPLEISLSFPCSDIIARLSQKPR